ncbi:MAG: hypothetical protein IKC69_00630 [Clostridia bacterium]|nr:hypothetical protein [Clostridia bacterium]
MKITENNGNWNGADEVLEVVLLTLPEAKHFSLSDVCKRFESFFSMLFAMKEESERRRTACRAAATVCEHAAGLLSDTTEQLLWQKTATWLETYGILAAGHFAMEDGEWKHYALWPLKKALEIRREYRARFETDLFDGDDGDALSAFIRRFDPDFE